MKRGPKVPVRHSAYLSKKCQLLGENHGKNPGKTVVLNDNVDGNASRRRGDPKQAPDERIAASTTKALG